MSLEPGCLNNFFTPSQFGLGTMCSAGARAGALGAGEGTVHGPDLAQSLTSLVESNKTT